MRRVLRPAGRLLVLEFSKPTLEMLKPAYDAYSFNVLPRLGGIIAGDAASYRYLAESIRMHPDQETLAAMFRGGGLRRMPLAQPRGRRRRVAHRRGALTRMALEPLSPIEAMLNRHIAGSSRARTLLAAIAGRSMELRFAATPFRVRIAATSTTSSPCDRLPMNRPTP